MRECSRDGKNRDADEFFIKWEGWRESTAVRLDQLVGCDTNGDPLEAMLLPYADGRPAPTYKPPEPIGGGRGGRGGGGRGRGRGGGGGEDEDEGEGGEDDEAAGGDDEVTRHGQRWEKSSPHGINVDARTAPRMKPVLNDANVDQANIVSLFYAMLPEGWIEDMLTFTARARIRTPHA